MSEKTAAVLNEILKNVVVARNRRESRALPSTSWPARPARRRKRRAAATAPTSYVGSFAGYVPADRPRLVILVVIDEPQGAQYGGTVAAPVFREIAEATLRYLGVAPSDSVAHDRRRAAAAGRVFATSAASRPRPSAVPDLRGLDARAAIARAVASGLTVRAIGSGVVPHTDPEPGEALPSRSPVVLTLQPRGARMKLRELLRDVPVRATRGDLDVDITSRDARLAPGHAGLALRGHPGTAKGRRRSSSRRRFERAPPRSLRLNRGTAAATRAASTTPAPRFRSSPRISTAVRPTSSRSSASPAPRGRRPPRKMIESVFDAAGEPVGLIGTIEYRAGDERLMADRTTPDAVVLQQWFAKMVDAGVRHAVMEVSSHALALKRTLRHPFRRGRLHEPLARPLRLSQGLRGLLRREADPLRPDRPDAADAPSSTSTTTTAAAWRPSSATLALTFGPRRERRHSSARTVSRSPVDGLRGTRGARPHGEVRVESPLLGLPNLYNWLGAIGAALVGRHPASRRSRQESAT